MSLLGDHFPEDRDSQPPPIVSVGSVLRLMVDDTTPPKVKFFIVVGQAADGISLASVYINTAVNPNVNWALELKQLHIPILQKDYPFLTHDSFVDCSKLIERDQGALQQTVNNRPNAHVGLLSSEQLKVYLEVLVNSPTIKGKTKKRFGFYN